MKNMKQEIILARLRHLYAQLVNSCVINQPGVARHLLGPVIVALEHQQLADTSDLLVAQERERCAYIVESAEPWIGKKWVSSIAHEIRDP